MHTTTPKAFASSCLALLLPLTLAALLACSCGEDIEDPGAGSLEVQWAIAPRGCDQADVGHVDVVLSRDGLERRERLECGAQECVIEGVEASEYTVTLYGIDAQNQETFASETKRVRIEPERMARIKEPVRLSARPAHGVLDWRFGDGRVCGAHGVKDVNVVFYDQWDSEVTSKTFECNKGGGDIEDIPAGVYQVYAEAVGAREVDGVEVTPRFQGVVDVTLGRGGYTSIDLVLFERVNEPK